MTEGKHEQVRKVNTAVLSRWGGVETAWRYQRDSFWADSNNKVINDLVDFTKTFFSKHTLLNILTKYCVFTSERMLMVMRP